jgi:hypothetical protein
VGCRQVAAVTSSNVSFGLIPPEDWNQPDWIDEKRAKAGRDALVRQNIIYGGETHCGDISRPSRQLLTFKQTVYRTRFRVLLETPRRLNVLPGTETCAGFNQGRFTSRSWFSPIDGTGASSRPFKNFYKRAYLKHLLQAACDVPLRHGL